VNQKLWWYTVRASGITAWALVAASVIWGLALSARPVRRPRPSWMLDLHRFLGGLAFAFVAVHLIGLLVDSFVGFGFADLFVPFASKWRPDGLAWGIVALYLLVAVELTSVAMRRLPRGLWHAIHLSSFAIFVLVTVHAFSAGADATEPWMIGFAVVTSVAVGVLLVLRLFSLRGTSGIRSGRGTEPKGMGDGRENELSADVRVTGGGAPPPEAAAGGGVPPVRPVRLR
jgi:DMSO/TMAO reductase YedYZ heme-binding membrane subunit